MENAAFKDNSNQDRSDTSANGLRKVAPVANKLENKPESKIEAKSADLASPASKSSAKPSSKAVAKPTESAEWMTSIQSKAGEFNTLVQDFVKKSPLQAIAIAVGAGVLASFISSKIGAAGIAKNTSAKLNDRDGAEKAAS